MKIAVLISTYNGEKFITRQLDSILNQKNESLTIYIRDDLSTDETKNILTFYREKHPSKIKILHDELGNVGVRNSYDILLSKVESDLFFFADQDDYWKENRIKKYLEVYSNVKKDGQSPTLLFSDMDLLDEQGKVIQEKYISKKVSKKNYNNFFKGSVSGCLMMFDNDLKLQINKLDTPGLLHDYHIYLTACLFGKVVFIPQVLLEHNIHQFNHVGVGVKKSTLIETKDFLKFFFNNKAYREIKFNHLFKIKLLDKTSSNHIKIEFLSSEEINKLSYLNRKKWYLKHLYTKEKGIYSELISFLLF